MKTTVAVLFALLVAIVLVSAGCTFCCEDCEEEPLPSPPPKCTRDNPGTPGCPTDTGVQCDAEQIPAMCPDGADPGSEAPQCDLVGRCVDDPRVSLYCCPLVIQANP